MLSLASQRGKWVLTTPGLPGAPFPPLASRLTGTEARPQGNPSVSNFTLSSHLLSTC